MSHIQWDETLETGNTRVDDQHKDLFAMVNDLRDACVDGSGGDAVAETLDRLSRYVNRHFAEEEMLMVSSGYPAAQASAHMAEHAKLRTKTAELLEQHASGALVTVLPVTQFLFDWLRDHIRSVDARFVAHLKSSSRALEASA